MPEPIEPDPAAAQPEPPPTEAKPEAPVTDEERQKDVGDFITRHVLEKDSVFFEG